MAMNKGTGTPARNKGAGGPIEGYGTDTSAPPMARGISKSGAMKPKPIKANQMPAFCGGGSVQGGFRNNAMKGRK